MLSNPSIATSSGQCFPDSYTAQRQPAAVVSEIAIIAVGGLSICIRSNPFSYPLS